MTKRIQKVLAAVAALAALALGGAVFAQAQSPEQVGGKDTDNIQHGDQTTPDAAAAKSAKATKKATHKSHRHAGTRAATQTGAAEQPGAANPETASESATGNDGPGGHADEANGGNANADHQFQGNE